MSEKKVVFYSEVGPIDIGYGTLVVPLNHTGAEAVNGLVNRTTVVEKHDPATGVFETKNTIYKPNLILG